MQEVDADILDFGEGGLLGRCEDGRRLWISGPGVPGDRVRVLEEGKTARIVACLRPAANRIPAPCPHAESCPGCQLQPLPYPEEARLKAEKLQAALARIGGAEDYEWRGLQAAEAVYGYRNRIELQVPGHQLAYLGDQGPVPIQDCLLADAPLREVLGLLLHDLLPALPRAHGLRRLILRNDGRGGPCLLLWKGTCRPATLQAMADALKPHPFVSGMALQNERDGIWHSFFGKDRCQLRLEDQNHTVLRDGFFQVNTGQAERLVAEAMHWAAERSIASAVDLFCGVGAFTFPLTRQAERVLGLDLVPGRTPDSRNPLFLAADLHKGLPRDLPAPWRQPVDLVVLDPPRAGMSEKLVRPLCQLWHPPRILYVSCNPATLARDCARLREHGNYRVRRAMGFDLFPRTTHMESLVLLESGETPA